MMPDDSIEDLETSGVDAPVDFEELEDPAAASAGLRGFWPRLPPAVRALTVGVLGTATLVAAVLLRTQTATEGDTAVLVHRPPRSSAMAPLRQLQTPIAYDESQGTLAKEAIGLPGMPPMQVGKPLPYAGKFGDWNGQPPKATSIHDIATPGLKCRVNEELFLGICYKNCTLLTAGMYPTRFAPNGCCRELPCLTPSEVDMEGFAPGTGYIVGAEGTGHYPHPPGDCLGNEEEHLGLCYKKCMVLTNGQYRYRVAANTCCKQSPCWNPFNLDTKGEHCTGYGVGGGLEGKLSCPHKPVSNP